jgi:hypothetical protein
MKPKRVCEISLKFQPLNTITTHLHSSKTIIRFPFYFPSSSQLPRLIIFFPPHEACRNKYSQDWIENYVRGKEEASIIQVCLLKSRRRKVKVDPKLDGQWKEKEKVLYSVANGTRRKRFFSTFSHFPPKQLHLNLHFLSFDIKVLLYNGLRPLFTHALPFLWPINYDRISWCYKSPPTFIADLILLKIFPLFLEIMAWRIVTSYGPQAA